MSHPRQPAKEELSAAMLAVSGYNLEQRQLQQFVNVPDSQVLVTASDESDDEEIVSE
jgi:hypothetical protein